MGRPRQLSAVIAVGLLGLGTVAVIREGLWHARTRLGRQGSAAAATALLGATVDELIPGRNRSRLLAIESERTRLASDLHADVLPELADVIRSADAGMDPTETASRLRAVADELRDLMAERRLTVLDALGLVPALEWLAERIEERTKVRVEIDIRGDDAQRAPREVELAAYRIAQQAIDNALIHAHADTIRIDLTISGNRLELDVTDDGLGLPVDAEARALRAGHLGLADMRARAAAIGGTFRIGSRADSGTTAALRWPVCPGRRRRRSTHDLRGPRLPPGGFGGIEVVGTARDIPGARELIRAATPDVVLCDIELGGGGRGFELLEEPRPQEGATPTVVFFSAYDYPAFRAPAMQRGAAGYLLKTAPVSEILDAIRTAAAGGTTFTPRELRAARSALRPPSGRELEVIGLIVTGHSNDEIAAALAIV